MEATTIGSLTGSPTGPWRSGSLVQSAVALTVTPPSGEPYLFEPVPGVVSDAVCASILAGQTYPVLPFIGDVDVVVDAGANCGAASVYFAQHYPDAVVHAIEPARAPLGYLRRNVRELPNVVVHPVGLHSSDQEVALFHGKDDTGTASIVRSDWHRDSFEIVQLRAGAGWANEHDIQRIDVLKVDVELSELDVLEGFGAFVPAVKAIYLEYGSRKLRRAIDRLLDPTHDLYLGEMSLDQGECVYVRRDLADLDAATTRLWEIYVERARAREAGT